MNRGIYLERTYSEALFELADKLQLLDEVMNDLSLWSELCDTEKDFEKLIVSPYFPSEYKQRLVSKMLSDKITDLTMNFLMVVIKRNRIALLPKVISEYTKLWEARAGYCPVDVTVAKQMSPDETEKLSQELSSAMNCKIKLKLSVDSSIIGGIIIRYDTKVIDNTIQGRLKNAVKTIIKQGMSRKLNEV